jgi:hypothetical protein
MVQPLNPQMPALECHTSRRAHQVQLLLAQPARFLLPGLLRRWRLREDAAVDGAAPQLQQHSQLRAKIAGQSAERAPTLQQLPLQNLTSRPML